MAQALGSEPPAAPPALFPEQGPPGWGRDLFAPGRPRAIAPIPYAPAEGLVPDYLPPSGRRRRGMTIFATMATIVVLTAGSAAGWRLSHRPGPNATTPLPRSPSARTSSTGASSTGASSTGASSVAASSHGVPRPPASSDTVAVAPAVARAPHAQQAAALLTAYFTSINHHDFEAYNGLFIPQIRGTLRHFDTGYASTTDSGATLAGLAAAGQRDLAATVTFTSHQNPADSPDHAACDTWTVVIPLTRAGAGYLIGRSAHGYHPSVRACA